MQADNLTVAYLVHELGAVLEGSYVNKVSEIENGTLKLKLHTKQGSKDLLLANDCFFLSSYSHGARHGKTPFAESMRKELYNKRIVGIEQQCSDRIVVIKLLEHNIVLELIGDGNKILADKSWKILSCQRKEQWADRVTKKGEIYKLPKQKNADPKMLDENILAKAFSSSDKDAIRALISNVNISPLFAEEIFHRLKIQKTIPAKEIKKIQITQICNAVRDFFTPEKNEIKPVLYADFAYPFPLMHINEKPMEMPSLNACFDDVFSRSEPKAIREKTAEKKNTASKLEFMRKQQDLARAKFSAQMEENTKKAELIYQNFVGIESLRAEILRLAKSGLDEKQILKAVHEESKSRPEFGALRKVDMKYKKFEIEI